MRRVSRCAPDSPVKHHSSQSSTRNVARRIWTIPHDRRERSSERPAFPRKSQGKKRRFKPNLPADQSSRIPRASGESRMLRGGRVDVTVSRKTVGSESGTTYGCTYRVPISRAAIAGRKVFVQVKNHPRASRTCTKARRNGRNKYIIPPHSVGTFRRSSIERRLGITRTNVMRRLVHTRRD